MDKKILTLRASLQEKQKELEGIQNALIEGGEERSLTTEESEKVKKLSEECRGLQDQIKVLEDAANTMIANRGILVNPVTPTPAEEFGEQQRRDVSKFSVLRAIQQSAADKQLSGIEKEINEEAVKETRSAGVPFSPQVGGSFMIPGFIINSRAVTATGSTSVAGDQGGFNVATNLMQSVPSLDSAMVLSRLGVDFMTGLVGNYDFPTESDNFRPEWASETGDAAEDSLAYGKKSLTPKRLAGYLKETSQILVQTSPSFEARIRTKIINGTALEIQRAAINGSGSSNQPTGILNTSGVVSVVGGTNGAIITRDHLVSLVNGPGSNDYEGVNFAWLTNFSVRGKLMTTKTDAGSGLFLMNESDKSLFGYDIALTTAVPNNLTKGTASGTCSAVVFGDFSQLKIGQWGGINVVVDPYTIRHQGQIRLIVETFADALALQPKAFAVMKDALIA